MILGNNGTGHAPRVSGPLPCNESVVDNDFARKSGAGVKNRFDDTGEDFRRGSGAFSVNQDTRPMYAFGGTWNGGFDAVPFDPCQYRCRPVARRRAGANDA
jgi:hypothetical protein